MNDLTNHDLCLLAAALRGFIHKSRESVDYYIENDDAMMLLTVMKERDRAKELLNRVLAAEDKFYAEGSLQEWE
jgi:hypothetical protein